MLTAGSAFSTYAIAATILALHLVAIALWTGTVRAQRKKFVNPEDAKLNKVDQSDSDHEDVLRAKRAHLNAMENALPFFVIGALYAATSPSKTGALAYFGTFVGARVLHSIFYLWGRQPFRSLSFVIGVLTLLGMGIHVVRAAL